MISDVLSEAIGEINQYLDDNTYDQVYCGDLRLRIVSLVKQMDNIRIELDTCSSSKGDE